MNMSLLSVFLFKGLFLLEVSFPGLVDVGLSEHHVPFAGCFGPVKQVRVSLNHTLVLRFLNLRSLWLLCFLRLSPYRAAIRLALRDGGCRLDLNPALRLLLWSLHLIILHESLDLAHSSLYCLTLEKV